MRAGDVIEASPDVLGPLPRDVRRWVKSAVGVVFLVLLVVGKADDVVLWLVRELTAVAADRMQPISDAMLRAITPTPKP